MNVSYFDYEFSWSYLKQFKEWFNSKYENKIELEPFLMSGDRYDIIGMFTRKGLIMFFNLDCEVKDFIIKDGSFMNDYVSIKVNPNNMISFKDLEFLILDFSVKYRMKKEVW